jgi:hypothetical protein
VSGDNRARYREVLRVFEKQLACAEIAGADPAFLRCGSNIVAFLRSRSTQDVESIAASGELHPPWFAGLSDKDIADLPIEDIERLLAEPNVPRKVLDGLAKSRFGLTRGEVSALSSRAKLADKLHVLIANERTDAAIGRAAAETKDRGSRRYP